MQPVQPVQGREQQAARQVQAQAQRRQRKLSTLDEDGEDGLFSRLSMAVRSLADRRRSAAYYDENGSMASGSVIGADAGLGGGQLRLQKLPSLKEVGPKVFLKDEMSEARKAVQALDSAVAAASSHREKASMMLEEAHRALSRLEQATETRSVPELIVIACEIKVSARRGLTLINVYGGLGVMGKLMTVGASKGITAKYEKVTDHLRSLMVLESRRNSGGVPPAPSASTQRTLSVTLRQAASGMGMAEGSYTSAMAPPAETGGAAGGGGGGPLAAMAGGGGSGRQLYGVELRGKRNNRVLSIAFLPPDPYARVQANCIWWSVGSTIEFYSESSESTTAFTIERPQEMAVTCIAIDQDNNVWTGHARGAVRVRQKQHWELIFEDKAFTSAVRVIVFDDQGRAWVGDDIGSVKVMCFHTHEGWLETLASLGHRPTALPSPASPDPAHAAGQGSTAAAGAGGAGVGTSGLPSHAAGAGQGPSGVAVGGLDSRTGSLNSRSSSNGAGLCGLGRLCGGDTHTGNLEGTVRCIHVIGVHAWVSASRPSQSGRLFLWNTTSYAELDVWECGAFGACTSMSSIGWAQHTDRRSDSPQLLSAASSSASRLTLPAEALQAMARGELLPAQPADQGPSQSQAPPLRLLTGHENGQLLLWRPDHTRLAPLIRIGEPSSPIRGIAVFEEWGIVCTGHANGEIWAFSRPAGNDGSAGPQFPMGVDKGQGASANFGEYRPKRIMLKAFRRELSLLVSHTYSLVAASSTGRIRMWHSRDIAAEAERQGLNGPAAAAAAVAVAATAAALMAPLRVPSFSLTPRMSAQLPPGSSAAAAAAHQLMLVHRVNSGTAGSRASAASASGRDSLPNTGGLPFGRDSNPLGQMGFGRGSYSGWPGATAGGGTGGASASILSAAAQLAERRTSLTHGAAAAGGRPGSQIAANAESLLDLFQMHQALDHLGSDLPKRVQSFVDMYGEDASPGSNYAAPPGNGAMALTHQGSSFSDGGSSAGSGNSGHQGPHPLPVRGNSARMLMMGGAAGGGGTPGSPASPAAPYAFAGACQTIDASELSLRKLVGSGAYGKVWLADWTGCEVAVKELLGFSANSADGDLKAWQEMQNEVNMLGSLLHPNITRFMAVCLDPPMIVMQYYAHGSLFGILQRASKGEPRAVRELSWVKRLEMLRDVAAGMHYLHTRRPPIIHGDLRSPNLLLDMTIDNEGPRFHLKIADFGLARMMNQNGSQVMLSKTTNPRWTAPEVIRDSAIGTAGDVYSFAIIMWEMLTWQQPYEEMMSVQVIFNAVSHHTRPDVPPDSELPGNPGRTLQQYKALMERCWSSDAAARPSFKQIVESFQRLRAQEDPPGRAQAGGANRSPLGRGAASASATALSSMATSAAANGNADAAGTSGRDSAPTSPGLNGHSAPLGGGGGMTLFGMDAIAEENERASAGSAHGGGSGEMPSHSANGMARRGLQQRTSATSAAGAGQTSRASSSRTRRASSGSPAVVSGSPFAVIQQPAPDRQASKSRREPSAPSSASLSTAVAAAVAGGVSPFAVVQHSEAQQRADYAHARSVSELTGANPRTSVTSASKRVSSTSGAKQRRSSTSAAVVAEAVAAGVSPFAAVQPPAAPGVSPFAAVQHPASASTSPFATVQSHDVHDPSRVSSRPSEHPSDKSASKHRRPSSASPFAAAQAQGAPEEQGPQRSEATHKRRPSSASVSPFAVVQQQDEAQGQDAAPKQQRRQSSVSVSPFAAVQQPGQEAAPTQRRPSVASVSPFAAAQQQPAVGAPSTSPSAAVQAPSAPVAASVSPFLAAQQAADSSRHHHHHSESNAASPSHHHSQSHGHHSSSHAHALPSSSPFAAVQQVTSEPQPSSTARSVPRNASPFAAVQAQGTTSGQAQDLQAVQEAQPEPSPRAAHASSKTRTPGASRSSQSGAAGPSGQQPGLPTEAYQGMLAGPPPIVSPRGGAGGRRGSVETLDGSEAASTPTSMPGTPTTVVRRKVVKEEAVAYGALDSDAASPVAGERSPSNATRVSKVAKPGGTARTSGLSKVSAAEGPAGGAPPPSVRVSSRQRAPDASSTSPVGSPSVVRRPKSTPVSSSPPASPAVGAAADGRGSKASASGRGASGLGPTSTDAAERGAVEGRSPRPRATTASAAAASPRAAPAARGDPDSPAKASSRSPAAPPGARSSYPGTASMAGVDVASPRAAASSGGAGGDGTPTAASAAAARSLAKEAAVRLMERSAAKAAATAGGSGAATGAAAGRSSVNLPGSNGPAAALSPSSPSSPTVKVRPDSAGPSSGSSVRGQSAQGSKSGAGAGTEAARSGASTPGTAGSSSRLANGSAVAAAAAAAAASSPRGADSVYSPAGSGASLPRPPSTRAGSMQATSPRMAPHAPSQPGQSNARARRRSLTTSEDDQGLYILGYRTSQEAASGHTEHY